MKNLKKLIPAICMLLMTAVMLSTASYAWFSMNTTVRVTGMQVTAQATSSLVISKTTTFTAANTDIAFAGETYSLMPATVYTSSMKDNTNSHADLSAPASNLATVANGNDVNPATGLAKDTKTLYYQAATTAATASDAGYYYDYVMYLAAEGGEDITSGTLAITVTKVESFEEAALQATAIGVIYSDDTAFTGDIIYLKDGVSSQTVKELSDSVKIPKGAAGTVGSAMKITLRVFIDGAAVDTDSTTFVKNATIVDLTKAASFDVTFTIE